MVDMPSELSTSEVKMDSVVEKEKNIEPKTDDTNDKEEEDNFKKPLSVVKGDNEHKKPIIGPEKPPPNDSEEDIKPITTIENSSSKQTSLLRASIPYKEPYWSGLASKPYSFDVLKNGSIVDKIELVDKAFYIFGRLPTCDVTLEHPSLSRYHACMQHCGVTCDRYQQGWYLYDLDSTHGTWINKVKVRPKVYHRIRVGHVIKLGGSSRLFILQGPEEDREEEAELSVTELKLQREKQKKEADLLRQDNLMVNPSAALGPDDGCMWGMDMTSAVEETNENPFSEEIDESLYIDDPKRCLKNYFDREGYDAPEYEASSEGGGRFKCCLELPIDDANGRAIIAEATVSGKKREAVEACALEACRILDRHGVLRAATHESRKRKKKNWEENDFYDSDEDTFLDRTGTIEKKRVQRMKKAGKLDDKVETYESLSEKHSEVLKEMEDIEGKLEQARADAAAAAAAADTSDDLDALDVYMVSIKSGMMDTKTRMKLKCRLLELKPQEQRLRKLVNIARPVSLDCLKPKAAVTASTVKPTTTTTTESMKPKVALPMFGKMKGLHGPKTPKVFTVELPGNKEETTEGVMEVEEEEEEEEGNNDDDDGEDKKGSVDNGADGGSGEPRNNDNSKSKHRDGGSGGGGGGGVGSTIGKGVADKSFTPHSFSSSSSSSSSSSPSSSSKPPTSKTILPKISTSDYLSRTSENKKSKADPLASFDADDTKVVWLPPSNQTGDGRTSLNEKYGY